MAPHKVSDALAQIIDASHKRGGITVQRCISSLGDQSILVTLLLLSLVNSFPLPGIPGLSTITGILIMFLGFQLMIGTKKIWLPQRVSCYRVRSGKLLSAMEAALPRLRKLECNLKRRLPQLCNPPVRNVLGMVFMILGFLLALPIPFANFPLGLSMTILAIGLMVRDGLVILIGLLLALGFLGLAVTLVNGSWDMLFA